MRGQVFTLPIDVCQQRPAIAEAVHADLWIEPQPVYAKARRVGVVRDLPGIVPWPQEAGMLSRPSAGAVAQERRQVDAAGDAVVARLQIAQGRRVAWPVVARCQPIVGGWG